MAQVMAVEFERFGRLYYLDPGPHPIKVGDQVLVPTDNGAEVARCTWISRVTDSEALQRLPQCLGRASDADLERDAHNRQRRAETMLLARRLIEQQKLPMKVVAVDWLDRSDDFDRQAVVYFTAPHRVDFRALVGELARGLQARIDLRQIGARDAAQLTGGIGNCGRELCCATFLDEPALPTMRMVKAQDLPPNPLRIAGACGRMMCCMRYEHPLYEQFLRETPAVGDQVVTDAGPAVVVGHSVPAGEVALSVRESGETTHCTAECARAARQAYLDQHGGSGYLRRRRSKRKPSHDAGSD